MELQIHAHKQHRDCTFKLMNQADIDDDADADCCLKIGIGYRLVDKGSSGDCTPDLLNLYQLRSYSLECIQHWAVLCRQFHVGSISITLTIQTPLTHPQRYPSPWYPSMLECATSCL